MAGADFLFEFWDKKEDKYLVKIKNKLLLGDEIEIITPNEKFITKVTSITNKDDDDLCVANTNDELYLTFLREPEAHKYALARTIGIKNER